VKGGGGGSLFARARPRVLCRNGDLKPVAVVSADFCTGTRNMTSNHDRGGPL